MDAKFNRVIVYVDGFNLYFGIKDASFAELKWSNNIFDEWISVMLSEKELMRIRL
jgi:hypothetical protein